MSTAKLAIMILTIAVLLFVVAPKLSWGDCSRPTDRSLRLTTRLSVSAARL